MILLKPDWRARTAFVTVLAISAAGWVLLLSRWSDLRLLERVLLGATAAIFGLFALDGLQRRYELRSSQISVRYLFVVWSVYNLPREVRMRTDRRRRLVVSGLTGRAIVLPRVYNRLGELEKRYWHMREFMEPVVTEVGSSVPAMTASPATTAGQPVLPAITARPSPAASTRVEAR
jgi:hypothetical protein